VNSPRIKNVYVLSPLQQGLLFHHLHAPAASLYVDQLLLDLSGAVDAKLLAEAWRRVVARHDALRTSFHWQNLDQPLQVVHPQVDLSIAAADLGALAPAERGRHFAELCAADRRRGFDLSQAPLLRLTLVRTGGLPGTPATASQPAAAAAAATATLVWTYHHILLDAWSGAVIQREVLTVYLALLRGAPAELPPARQFGDYIGWLRRRDAAAGEQFWRAQLRGATAPTPLGVDLPAPPRQEPGEAPDHAESEAVLAAAATARLQAFGRRHHLTLNTLFQGAWAVLLHRYSGEPDLVFGATVSGRPPELPGIDGIVGLFINALPVRVRLDGREGLVPWLQGLQRAQGAALEHQYSALADLQSWSGLPPGRPLFESLVVFENVPTTALDGNGPAAGVDAGLASGNSSYVSRTNYPLVLVAEPGVRLSFRAIFDRRRLAPPAVTRLLGHLVSLLEALPEAARGADLPLLSAAERQQMVREWNDTAAAYPRDATLADLFDAAAARHGERPAIESAGVTVTYAALAARAARLAHRLVRLGLGVDTPVAVCLEPSIDLVVSWLAVVKAGAAYAPLDPANPPARLRLLLEDLGGPPGITTTALEARLDAGRALVRLDEASEEPAGGAPLPPLPSVPPLPRRAAAENLAYVTYTSGSTGRPKGVAVTHRAVARLLFAAGYVDLSPADRIAQVANVAFDAITFEVWGALLHGGCLVLVPRAVSLSPIELAARLKSDRISALFLTSALFHQVAREAPAAFAPLRHLLTGGEVVEARWVAEVQRAGPPERLLDVYGPTESTTFATWHRVSGPAEAPLPIGLPIGNTRLHLLDAGMQPVPIGAAGEIHLGGDGLARGYFGRPDLTAERFVPDPLAAVPGERLYRTGDLARRRPDGAVEFLGRNDFQLKVRGFRVEPGEIEAALAAAPEVEAAVVLLAPGPAGDERLTAFVAAAATSDLAARLRDRLERQLPPPMVPAAIVAVAALPLTASGKLDRQALRALASDAPTAVARTAAAALPSTPVEQLLAGIWAAVLGVEEVGADDDFLRLGGHSLLVTKVLSRVREAFGVELPLADLFAASVLRDQAARIEQALRAGAPAAPPPLLALSPRPAEVPLSFAQQRLWILDRFDPGLPAYNIPLALRLDGELAAGALERGFLGLMERHEALRTCFAPAPGGEGPVQQIEAPFTAAATPARLAWRLARVDLGGLPAARRDAELRRLGRAEAVRRFVLERAPLLRVTLVHLGDRQQALLLTVHHIVADGWSLGILFRELAALYVSSPEALPPLPVQYADYAIWQRGWLRGEVLERQLAYWRQRLAGASSLGLPADRPHPPLRTFNGAALRVPLPGTLAAELRRRAREERVTPFMILLASWLELQSRLSGRSDLTVGTPVANRSRLEIEGLIGFFVNTLVLRTDLSGEPTLRQLLVRVRETTLAAYTHQDLPFEKLVEELQPERSLALAPFFQVLVTLDTPPPPPDLPGLAVAALAVESGAAKFEITLALTLGADFLFGALEYNFDLFDRSTALRLAHHYAVLLGEAVAHPEAPAASLAMLGPVELHQLTREWNDTAAAPPPPVEVPGTLGPRHPTLDLLVALQAARTPDRVAVVAGGGGEALRYADLDRLANQLAHRLIQLGVGPEVPVGVFTERTLEMVVAILGVLRAGGAYVPLDPAYPAERLALTLADCGAPVVVTQEWLSGRLPGTAQRVLLDAGWESLAGLPEEPPAGRPVPGNLAYVIYTSGSTGRPKGVAIEHASAVALLRWAAAAFADDEVSAVAATTSICFDLSIFELFVPLTRGGRVLLLDSALDLAGMAGGFRATLLNTVPSAAAELAGTGALPPSLRTLNLAGEPIPPALAAQLQAAGPPRLLNLYGPSEATTYSTWARIDSGAGEAPPIGRPIAGTEVYLLDGRQRPVPIGVPGEVYIAGEGLARGYLGRPDLTAAAFLPHPLAGSPPGRRVYRTGDLARARSDGRLVFLGRIDHQVKVRGFRIELGEIEATLRQHPAVAAAAAAVHADAATPEDRRLVAYVVPAEGHGPQLETAPLRALLRSRLPEFMVPAVFVTLPALPLTATGKVDRAALPDPGRVRRGDAPWVEPRTASERAVAAVVREVLGLDRVGRDDNFFDLGGHSLLMIRAAGLLGVRLGRKIEVLQLFRFPTVAALAAHLESAEDAPPAAAPAGEPPPSGEEPAAAGRAKRREMRRRLAGVDS
jgi:amino acid adenylation domain-containing protein